MTDKSSAIPQPYEIVSVRRAEPPLGAKGSNWYRYEIAQGNNIIDGYRQGNLESVTMAVEVNVAQLNERQLGKRGHVHIALVPTPKKKAHN